MLGSRYVVLSCLSAAACGGAGAPEQVDTASEASSAPPLAVPTSVAATAMTTKTTGEAEGSVWNLYANGYLANWFAFPADGAYNFTIDEKSHPPRTHWSFMVPPRRACVKVEIDFAAECAHRA